jgi:hypothetical protein
MTDRVPIRILQAEGTQRGDLFVRLMGDLFVALDYDMRHECAQGWPRTGLILPPLSETSCRCRWIRGLVADLDTPEAVATANLSMIELGVDENRIRITSRW